MNFASEASKLLCNKYFLYFVTFLAVTNVLGYLVTNKVNAVIFFALVAFLTSNFSKNMAVVLLVAMVATNMLMANKSMREGLENQTTNPVVKEAVDTDKLSNVDPQLGNGLSALNETGSVDAAKARLSEKKTTVQDNVETRRIEDPNNRTEPGTEPAETEGFGSNAAIKGVQQAGKKAGFHNNKRDSSFKDAAPVNGNSRIDYATTLEDAYDNLDKILGSGNIKNLTNDTQKLMVQQQKLFDTMSGMMPMIESAKSMMQGFDMSQLNSLADMASGKKA